MNIQVSESSTTTLSTGLPAEPASGRGRSHGTSGTEPFDRWFRYPAGFASDYVSMLLEHLALPTGSMVVDPFAGSAVTGTAARRAGLSFFGIEAHPLIAELANLKLKKPPGSPAAFLRAASIVVDAAKKSRATGSLINAEVDLTRRCFTPDVLADLCSIREAILDRKAGVWGKYAKWALLATLRDVASARVGWPYQRPGQARQPKYADAYSRFLQRANLISEDIGLVDWKSSIDVSAFVTQGDARRKRAWKRLDSGGAHGCVASPPYLNNFDYADATRLELYFWGEVSSWAEMVTNVRSDMVTATTQQSSVGAASDASQRLSRFAEIGSEVDELVEALKIQRTQRGRGKEYDRVVPDYFDAISEVLENLAAAMHPGSPVVWLIGDSAPYGVYIDTPAIIGRIAEQVGFTVERDEALRRRGQRWATNKTRHDVQLSERLILFRRG
ncbi:DNA methyltransferase [Amycolatopsis halotolerans]|uniref:Methyltransferase n=1 Tax=Amycolatopsis halotolerans TaxID=330083 RepID=A0ABV7QN15_9PSEU